MVVLEKDYIVRRIDPSTPRRVPKRRPPMRRRRPPLPLGFLALVAAVVVIIVVVIILCTRGKEEDQPDTSSVVSQASSEVISSQPPEPTPTPEPEEPLPDQEYPDAEPDTYDAMVVIEGTGYGLYKFSEEDTKNYIQLVCDAEESLPESATLYSMIVPTALDVVVAEDYITGHEIDSSDQRKAIEDYIYPSIQNLNGNVKTVSLFGPLRRHCDEYVYYNTDPSWTQLGAYYAYMAFCDAALIEPYGLQEFEEKSYSGYLGSYYSLSNDINMSYNADAVYAYVSSSNTSLSFTTQDGSEQVGWPVIQDGDSYESSYLSLIFIAGDQPYAEITNSDLDDGSTCLVVKDSFGNVFVPFLAEHYQHVYVVDYRYYSGDVPSLADETGATDVILLNGIRATSNADSISSLADLF